MCDSKFIRKCYRRFCFLKRYIKKKFLDSQTIIILFGIFGLFNYPFFYFYWKTHHSSSYDDSKLRILATLLCLLLALKNYWPHIFKPILPFFWYASVTFCIPFYATYVVLQDPTSSGWALNIFLGLFWLIILLDWVSFSLVVVCGSLLACLAHMRQGNILIFPNNIKENAANIFWVLAIYLIFLHRKDHIAKKKLQGMKALAGSIAHEMRTPLFALNAMAYRLKTHLPTVIHDFKQTKAFLTEQKPIKLIEDIPNTMEETIKASFNIIDILLMNLREGEESHSQEICSLNMCVEKALKDYHLSDEEENLIVWQKDFDFNFKENPLLIKHILFNLLKNALYFVKYANKGKIYINTSSHKHYNSLHFKDTGKGIPASILPYIFERFYSKTSHGTGIGLAFCKRVMEELGGKITCTSMEDEYVEFILDFPKI